MLSETRLSPAANDTPRSDDPLTGDSRTERVSTLLSAFETIAADMQQQGANAAHIRDFLATLLIQNEGNVNVRRLHRAVALLLRASWLEQIGQLSMAQVARDTSKQILHRMSDPNVGG